MSQVHAPQSIFDQRSAAREPPARRCSRPRVSALPASAEPSPPLRRGGHGGGCRHGVPAPQQAPPARSLRPPYEGARPEPVEGGPRGLAAEHHVIATQKSHRRPQPARFHTSRNARRLLAGNYLLLVDYTGRLFREGKAAISAELAGILERLGSSADRWRARLGNSRPAACSADSSQPPAHPPRSRRSAWRAPPGESGWMPGVIMRATVSSA